MRLDRLYVRGFGPLSDRDIRFNAPLAVLYGPNEAGKSSVLYFIRAMLYGFPARTMAAQRGEPAGGGIHGGELLLTDEQGNRWTIRRTAGSGHGSAAARESLTVSVTHPEGTVREASQAELERELLGGLSDHMFRQLFAITLSELQEVRALQSEEMNGFLFHAGIGGGSGIVHAEKRLLAEMDKLYKPRGRVQESAKIIQSIQQLRAAAGKGRTAMEEYNRAVSELELTEEELRVLESRRVTRDEELSLLRKAAAIRPVWMEWTEARLEYAELPERRFPHDGFVRLKSLNEEEDALIQRIQRASGAAEALNERLDKLPVRSGLEQLAPALQALWAERGLYTARKAEQEELEEEARGLGSRLRRILDDIDESWRPERLYSLKLTAAERENVRRMGSSFAGYDRRVESLALEERSARRELSAAEQALKEVERQLREEQERGSTYFYMIRPHEAKETMALWGRLQHEAERWREEVLTRSSQEPPMGHSARQPAGVVQLGGRRLLPWLAGAALLLTAGLLWLDEPAAAGVSLAFLTASAVYLWSKGRTTAHETGGMGHAGNRENRESAAALLSLMNALTADPYAAAAGEEGISRRQAAVPDEPVILEGRLKELRKTMEEWQSWQQRLQRLHSECSAAEERVQRQLAEVQHITRVIRQEESRFTELERHWADWLTGRELPVQLSPETVLDLAVKAEQGIELLQRTESLSDRRRALAEQAERYEMEAIRLLEAAAVLDSSANEEGASAGNAFDMHLLEQLSAEWEAYRETIQERRLLHVRQEELQLEITEAETALSRTRRDKELLLEAAGTADEEEFMRIGAAAVRRKELEQAMRHAEVVMFSGRDERFRKDLLTALEHWDADALEQQKNMMEEAAAEADAARDELQEKRGRLLQEKERLEREGLEETAHQQLREQQAALKEIAAQYAVRAISSELITRTRKIYEEDKQPEVLRLASGYFARLTDGAYSRIVMRLDRQTLLAEPADGIPVESSRLSRGTAEQLYLAMRLALAQLMPGPEKLPLVLDDLFVNFDGERLGSALSLLHELSASRQVILMTCHEHAVQRVLDQCPGAQVISMGPQLDQ